MGVGGVWLGHCPEHPYLGFFAIFYYRGYGSEYLFMCLLLMSILLFILIIDLMFRRYYSEVM